MSMIYKVTFGVGKDVPGATRGQLGGKDSHIKVIIVPEATSRGAALLKAADAMKDHDVYSAKVDTMDAEILGA